VSVRLHEPALFYSSCTRNKSNSKLDKVVIAPDAGRSEIELMKSLAPLVLFLLGSNIAEAQVDTNTIEPRKLLNFWAALGGNRAVRVGGFGDSVTDPTDGGKMDGFGPRLKSVLGEQSGGITSNFPYLYFLTNGIGDYHGPDTNWWCYHYYMTNGSAATYRAATPNGPASRSDYVWCDTVAVYYLTGPTSGSFTVSLSTNGGPFGLVTNVNAQGVYGGAVQELSLPLNYYQMRVAGANGRVALIDCGMWNEHQRNLTYVFSTASGMAYNDWTSVATNVTWPIFQAWQPTLLLLEAKDSAALFAESFPLLEEMFTNCAPTMDLVYLGTTAQATNGNPTVNDTWAIPQNNEMAALAEQFGRQYWNSFYIVSYEQATALGWTTGDGTHFNSAGGTALGEMLWNDVWRSFHQLTATIDSSHIALQWYAIPGGNCQVQYTSDVTQPNWQNLTDPLSATNVVMTSTDSIRPASARFYRVVALP
jgi:hypothetical protein